MSVSIDWFIDGLYNENKWVVYKYPNFDKHYEFLFEPTFINGYIVYNDKFNNKTFITNEFVDMNDESYWYNGHVYIFERFSYYKDNDTNIYYRADNNDMEFYPWDVGVSRMYELLYEDFLCIESNGNIYISELNNIVFYQIERIPHNDDDARMLFSLSKEYTHSSMCEYDNTMNRDYEFCYV